jgi:hypothetical protein
MDDPESEAALAAVADRLREAASIGSISDLHAIAQELIAGNKHQTWLAYHIIRLANHFEFDAIERLAAERRSHNGSAAD